MLRRHKSFSGFTLLEILIAMFIFTIVSLMLVSGLHTVINAQSGSEKKAERMRQLQIALLMLSRDVEQVVNRPVVNASGRDEAVFVGTPQEMTFTHTGLANPSGALARSTMQRTQYTWHDKSLWRASWPMLDRASTAEPHERELLDHVTDVHFEYLNKKGRFLKNWPSQDQTSQPLPRAVKVTLTLSDWGTMSQLYVISAQTNKIEQDKPKPQPPKS